ncbi:MAG TPA: toll/interleukin-1 receptor domain-containing protein [Candidatus Udaeobacter sp.]|nr:toll/interleukin-1 receptor domain-containing protein [Candidatus Udaeobacter sp.]
MAKLRLVIRRRIPLDSFRNRKRRSRWDVYVFLSYTSRESEVQLVQPLIDQYCRGLWEWADRNGIHVFYDHFSLPRRQFHDHELTAKLADAIDKSDLMTAFLSPEYISSKWCQFEWNTQYSRVRAARMLHDEDRAPQTHAIYWKPDIWSELQNGVTSPWGPVVEATFRETPMTDVTYVYHVRSNIPRAAEQCIHESANMIRQMFPDKVFRYEPGRFG